MIERRCGRAETRALLALALTALVGCGPSAREVGTAVLLATPVVLGLTQGVLWGLERLWRRGAPATAFAGPARALLGLAALWGLWGGAFAARGAGNAELVAMAVLLLGNVYLGLTLLVWRGWFAKRPEASFARAAAPLAALVFLPAPLVAHELVFSDDLVALYAYGAIGGLYAWPVTLALLVGFYVEAARRGAKPLE